MKDRARIAEFVAVPTVMPASQGVAPEDQDQDGQIADIGTMVRRRRMELGLTLESAAKLKGNEVGAQGGPVTRLRAFLRGWPGFALALAVVMAVTIIWPADRHLWLRALLDAPVLAIWVWVVWPRDRSS